MGYSGGLHQDAGFGFGMDGPDQMLQGSGSALNRATKTGGVLSFWSRSAQSSFYGQDGALALNGDVRSTMVGADYSKGRMVTGVSLSHTRGLGGYAGGADTGRMTSLVTGLYPWVGLKASERVTVWTVAGYGAGGLLLSPGGSAPIETGLSMAMAAGGGQGELMTSETGFELAAKADALWVGTRTDTARTPPAPCRPGLAHRLAVVLDQPAQCRQNQRTRTMGEIRATVTLENRDDRGAVHLGLRVEGDVRRATVEGIVDTGAVNLVVPEEIATELGLRAFGTRTVVYADERREERPVTDVTIEVGNLATRVETIVGPAGSPVLIGQVVLEQLDLIADCKNRTLTPRHPEGPVLAIR